MIKIAELFAGVGGFRLGFERSSSEYKTIWANQWEPGKKVQHAYNCYVKNFNEDHNCINEDIAKVKFEIPSHDIMVGGFPCQDYSVARTSAEGIEGKKGVLWWEIRDVIETKNPTYVLLENVDRLIKSPAKQRGRDFGIILRCFHDLNYNVEWRVVNAADYGHPQKRRRVFIFASRQNSKSSSFYKDGFTSSIYEKGIFARAFPILEEGQEASPPTIFEIGSSAFHNLSDISSTFQYQFQNAGIMIEGKVLSVKTTPDYHGPIMTLREVLEKGNINEKYFLNGEIDKWIYLKGAKRELRYKPNGEGYKYTEGAIPFPDNLDSPARTMLTSEASLNRSTHVVANPASGKLRRLTPIECERLNEFPDNWTDCGMPESARYFVMGNALVVGVVEKIADELLRLF